MEATEDTYTDISKLVSAGKVEEALNLIENKSGEMGKDATLCYLEGLCYMKKSAWHSAINCFLQAEAAGDDGRAAEAREMLEDILNFRNTDLYNP